MIPTKAIDFLPLWAVFAGTVLVALLAVEMGFRLGRSWQTRTHDEKEGPVGAMTAATLGLLAFLLAFITGMAVDRFDNRRALVIEEANAIGTTFLRAGFLDEPTRNEARSLLAEYVDTRLAPVYDIAVLDQARARSEQIQTTLWLQIEPEARERLQAPGIELYVDALNTMIDTHTKRIVAVTGSRIPGEIWIGIYSVAALAMLLLGLQTSYGERRNWLGFLVLVSVFAVVLTLIVDLDRPMEGLMTVSQQAMIDLQAQIRTFTP
jgi:hypothetical protein